MEVFEKTELKKLYKSPSDSRGEENGQVTIIGGSKLFHGAPLLALTTASRIVDMVFFASPEESLRDVVAKVKSQLFSFIWVPWDEVKLYVAKSDAVLIGPGMMRYAHETENLKLKTKNYDEEGKKTREITKRLLQKFPEKKWVIDAGSLQTMDAEWIPKKAVLTPNRKEFEMLFGSKVNRKIASSENVNTSDGGYEQSELDSSKVGKNAKKHNCTIVAKAVETIVCSPESCVKITGGNAGLTKGGTGDVLAGLAVALLAKNEPFLSACSAGFIVKAVADELYKKVGVNYSADDLAQQIPETLSCLV